MRGITTNEVNRTTRHFQPKSVYCCVVLCLRFINVVVAGNVGFSNVFPNEPKSIVGLKVTIIYIIHESVSITCLMNNK